MRHCSLGKWTCQPVSERYRLVWRSRLFDRNTYIPSCVRWHGGRCLQLLVPDYVAGIRLVQVHLPEVLYHRRSQKATILFVDFTKAFDSIHRGKMEQILLAYSLPEETVAAIMMLSRKTHVKVPSPDWDKDYFDIVAGVLKGDTLAPYLFIICIDYVLRTSIDKIKKNVFKLTKERRYSSSTLPWIIIIIIYSCWYLSDSRSLQVSRIRLRNLAVLSNAVIWIVLRVRQLPSLPDLLIIL